MRSPNLLSIRTTCLALAMLATVAPSPARAIDAGWCITEVLADPNGPGDADLDANGDGTFDASDDEFIEIWNLTGQDQDISGWTINDAVAPRHSFPDGTVVPDNCAIVVFGGGTPGLAFTGAAYQVASTGFLGFNNGGDTATLFNDIGEVMAEFIFGSFDGVSAVPNPDVPGEVSAHSNAADSGARPLRRAL